MYNLGLLIVIVLIVIIFSMYGACDWHVYVLFMDDYIHYNNQCRLVCGQI
jgi:hypothetical protein